MIDVNLFGWPDAVWLTLDQLGILGGDIVLILTVTAAMVGFIRRDQLRAWLVRNRFPHLGEAAAADNRYDGVVFTVGTIHTPAWVIETYRPAHVGLIATEYSLAVAEELAVRARKLGLTVHGPVRLTSADEIRDAHDATARLLASLAAQGAERIAVDVTGGKVPMSLGAFTAAEEHGATTCYVSVEYDGGKPRMDTVRFLPLSRPLND